MGSKNLCNATSCSQFVNIPLLLRSFPCIIYSLKYILIKKGEISMKKHTTKRALLMSALSLLVCVSMLVGSTFAWFTDSVSSDRNIIQAGNLDVTLEYWDGDSYEEVTPSTKLFNDAALWEPGHAEVAYLRIDNAGSLALKYQLAVNVYNETSATNVAGETFKLSDHLVFSVVDKALTSRDDMFTREQAIAAAGNAMGLTSYNSGTVVDIEVDMIAKYVEKMFRPS